MRKTIWNHFPIILFAVLCLGLWALPARPQVTTMGGKPTATSATVPVKTATDGTLITSGVAGAVPKTGAPSFSLSVSAVSANVTGLTASACYRLACSGPVFWRTGTGTPTALTTDNPLYGPAVEALCLPSTDTVFAAITAAGTATCTGTLLARTP